MHACTRETSRMRENGEMGEQFEAVRASYAARADEYVAALGSIGHAAPQDLELIKRWARSVRGTVLDVGSGPGQWTHYLSGLGVDAEGVDPVAEFVESAKATYPGQHYRVGRAEALDVSDDSLGGILAWYSLIHTHPEKLSGVLAEFARCVRPGGGLALGFFEGSELAPFEHAITTAYSWPVDLLTAEVEAVGFTVADVETRTDPRARPHGALLATRN